MKLDGIDLEKFKNALQDAYPSRNDLEQMVYYKLNKNLSTIADGRDLGEIIFRLIQKAEAEGWTEKLLTAAYAYNPGNDYLREFYEGCLSKYGIATRTKGAKCEKPKKPVSQQVATGKPHRSNRTTPGAPQRSQQENKLVVLPSSAFLVQANTYLSLAYDCVQTASALFKNNVLPSYYKKAANLLQQMQDHIQNLYELVDETTPFPRVAVSNQPQISKFQLITKIQYTLEEIEMDLLPSFRVMTPRYQDILKKLEKLELSLGEYYPLKLLRNQPDNLANDNGFKSQPEPSQSPLTRAMRLELIDTLLNMPVSNSFEGRSAFLIGIPDIGSLNRSPINARLDMDLIIDQLDKLGHLDSGDWPLPVMIDNALHFARGFKQPEEILMRIKQDLTKGYLKS